MSTEEILKIIKTGDIYYFTNLYHYNVRYEKGFVYIGSTLPDGYPSDLEIIKEEDFDKWRNGEPVKIYELSEVK